MATALTAGYAYLIESDAGENQNWVTDPENIDLDNFTEGTDYCKFQIPKQWIQNCFTGIKAQLASTGIGFQERSYQRGYLVEVTTNEAVGDIDLIDKFIMGNRHVATLPATYKPYYLILKRGTNDYVLFMDNLGTQREYCRGSIPDGSYRVTWNESESLRGTVQLQFMSGW